jgi:uncharacterized protein
MDKRKALSLAKRFIKSLPDDYKPMQAFLFGSFAKGSAHKYSDVDVALVFPKTFDVFDMRILLMGFRRSIDVSIEPHPIEEDDFNKSNPLAYEIMKFGIPLI